MSELLNLLIGASPMISFLIGLLSVCVTGREVHKIKIKKEQDIDKIRKKINHSIKDSDVAELYIEHVLKEKELEEELIKIDKRKKELDRQIEELENRLKELEKEEKINT